MKGRRWNGNENARRAGGPTDKFMLEADSLRFNESEVVPHCWTGWRPS